jgi:hypothetical protein
MSKERDFAEQRAEELLPKALSMPFKERIDSIGKSAFILGYLTALDDKKNGSV